MAYGRLLLEDGADGLAPFGTTSEATSLSVAERMAALEALVEAEASLNDGSPAKDVFVQIRTLFALSTINAHSGWYQEQNVLNGLRTKALRAAINDLVDSLGPWADVLVDAFAIPESLVAVPMLDDAGVDPR